MRKYSGFVYSSYVGADAWGKASETKSRPLKAEFVRRMEAAFPGLQIIETKTLIV